MCNAGRVLAVALVLLNGASPALGFIVGRGALASAKQALPSQQIETLQQMNKDHTNVLAEMKPEMDTWKHKMEALETLRSHLAPLKHTARSPYPKQDLIEVSTDEATGTSIHALISLTPKEAVTSPKKKTFPRRVTSSPQLSMPPPAPSPTLTADAASVTPEQSPEGSPAPFSEEGYATDKHKAKYVRETGYGRGREVEMPLTGQPPPPLDRSRLVRPGSVPLKS